MADECGAHVVLCPGTRLRARDNREHRTEKLQGGHWALHFGWKRGPCTNSFAGRTMILSRRIKRDDLYRIVAAPAAITGRGDGETTQWTFRPDSACGIPTAAHGEWGATSCTGEGRPHDTGISPPKKLPRQSSEAHRFWNSISTRVWG